MLDFEIAVEQIYLVLLSITSICGAVNLMVFLTAIILVILQLEKKKFKLFLISLLVSTKNKISCN